MTSGTFQVGETVVGEMATIGLSETSAESNANIRFRVLSTIIEKDHMMLLLKLM